MTRQTIARNGLDVGVPESGIARDAYEVACTAGYLMERIKGGPLMPFSPARHAVTLHRISGQLHRIAERQCNEDLTCPACRGEGVCEPGNAFERMHRQREREEVETETGIAVAAPPSVRCSDCGGAGNRLGRREARLERQCREIAEHYGLACYFQGDPRGCALYIGEAKDMTDANYNRGHAVTRLGR